MDRCPGSDGRKPVQSEEIACSKCGRMVEIFQDEPVIRCPGCKSIVENPRVILGCATWCAAAMECLGPVILGKINEPGELERLLSFTEKGDDDARSFISAHLGPGSQGPVAFAKSLSQLRYQNKELFRRISDACLLYSRSAI